VPREKDDSFASGIQANVTRTLREKRRYQNDTTWVIRACGSNPARHIKTGVQLFGALRPPSQASSSAKACEGQVGRALAVTLYIFQRVAATKRFA
jgi:hypothetical protein